VAEARFDGEGPAAFTVLDRDGKARINARARRSMPAGGWWGSGSSRSGQGEEGDR
jgi:hypothetical protein